MKLDLDKAASNLLTKLYFLEILCLVLSLLPFCIVTSLSAEEIELTIDNLQFNVDGRMGNAIAVNGSVPGPVLHLHEGQEAVIRVNNHLDQVTSIHWHGLIVPPNMDGVPGVSFAGIQPKSVFTYRFPVRQSGTYWAHAHDRSELIGLYFPVIIDPIEPDPFVYDQDYIVMLSDWSFEPPGKIIEKLKKMPDYYNFQKRTAVDFFYEVRKNGFLSTLSDRLKWSKMRMDPTDFADVTAYTFHYLINGLSPDGNWTGLFHPGERIRLRFIDAGAMTYFDVRIPGLKINVVQADGQNIKPVEVDEFRIAPGETLDVIVQPDDRAYTLFAESMDKSGYARGTLAPMSSMSAPIPQLRNRPLRTMADMGMNMSVMKTTEKMENMPGMEHMEMDESKDLNMSIQFRKHGSNTHGHGNSAVPEMVFNRLNEPGSGFEEGSKVLVYSDLESIKPHKDQREPTREIELHITGNMERYMWSFDGKTYAEAEAPISFKYGERIRLIFVNDTMMEHPIHLHGMFVELENGHGENQPLKHTVSVKPAERLSMIITANESGQWVLHCHLLLHMELGMFRVVEVSANPDVKPAVQDYARESQKNTQWPYPIADKSTFSYFLADLLEYQRIRDINALRWDAIYWHGNDYKRLWIKSEGILYNDSNADGQFDLQALYGKLISPFFDLQTGLRFEQHRQLDSNPRRVFAVVSMQGLSPYAIEIDPSLFLSTKGKLSGRFTAVYNILLTQRLVLQPRFETEAGVNEDKEFGVNSGINEIEAGLRLRYEIKHEFAPYFGISYRQSYDIARDRVRQEGGDTNILQFVVGLRTWF